MSKRERTQIRRVHNLKMFAIPPRERDLLYQAVEPVWVGSESFHVLGILIPVVSSYVTDKAQSRTGLERDLVQNVAEVAYNVAPLGTFLRGARYSPIEHLVYHRMVAGCEGSGALLCVSLCSIKLWYAWGICRLLQIMEVDPVLALVAKGRLTEINWVAVADQNRFSYNY